MDWNRVTIPFFHAQGTPLFHQRCFSSATADPRALEKFKSPGIKKYKPKFKNKKSAVMKKVQFRSRIDYYHKTLNSSETQISKVDSNWVFEYPKYQDYHDSAALAVTLRQMLIYAPIFA